MNSSVELLPPSPPHSDEAADATPEKPARRGLVGLARDYLSLTKPRIIVMAGVAVGVGRYAARGGELDLAAFAIAAAAVALVAAASFTFNQLLEKPLDARMDRTSNRALPSGRVSEREALVFGLVCAALGLGGLAALVNVAAAFLAAVTFFFYVWVYTPLKRRSTWNTFVGAIPGALPPVIGWVSATGRLDPGAWALFAILFLWQFPHFFAIAWMYREDYARAGMRMLPVVDKDGEQTARQMVLTSLALLPVSLIPTLIGLTGTAYLLGAIVLGLLYFAFAMGFALSRTDHQARSLFRVSLVYLPALLGLMMLDLIPV